MEMPIFAILKNSMIRTLSKPFLIITTFLFLFITFHPLVLAGPISEDYELQQYSFGAGGFENGTSEDYRMFGIAGDLDSGSLSSENYKALPGLVYTLLPEMLAPTLNNPQLYYNKLHLTLNINGHPSDTLFAVAISTDNFATDTQYIQDDNTIGSTLGAEDWRTYSGVGSWNDSTGIDIIGLSADTTYYVKAKAVHGDFTESGYSQVAQATTESPELSFDIDVSSSDTETAAPYTITFDPLDPATVITSTNKIWVDLSTNATSGGYVYVYSTNEGLLSSTTGTKIDSVTNDLSSALLGYGARINSVSESSGGPMQAIAPYNGSGDSVGVLDNAKRLMYDSSNSQVTNGRVSFELKAKASETTISAPDYSDIITVVVSGAF